MYTEKLHTHVDTAYHHCGGGMCCTIVPQSADSKPIGLSTVWIEVIFMREDLKSWAKLDKSYGCVLWTEFSPNSYVETLFPTVKMLGVGL